MVRRLRFALAGAAVLLVLALITGFVAVGQTGRARDEAEAARARQLSAQALGEADPALSALLAVAAVRMDDTPGTRASLATILARQAGLVATSPPVGPGLDRLVLSPDGTRLATYDEHNVVSLVDVATGRVMARYDAQGPGGGDEPIMQTSPLEFSPDGRTLAVAGQAYAPASLVLLDGSTLAPLPDQPQHLPRWRAKSPDVDFSADGRFVAASFMLLSPHNVSMDGFSGDGQPDRARTLVWDLSHLARRPAVIDVPVTGHVERMALSPDGSQVYLSSPVAAYSTSSGERLWRLPGQGTEVPIDLSTDGSRLAVATGRNQDEIALLDTRRGRLVRTLTGAPSIYDLDFSDDASQIAAIGGNGFTASRSQLLTWDITSAKPTRSIPIDTAWGVQLDATASRAYVTDPQEGTLVTWDLDGLSSYLRQEKAVPNVDGGFYRPAADGVHVASYRDHGLDLVNERTGTVSPLRDARTVSFFDPGSWRPDGRRFVLGTADGYVQVFDDTGRLRTEARVARATVTDVDYTSGGQTIAVSDLTGKVALLDASTLKAAGKPVKLDGPVAGVTLAPDGRTAFVVTLTESLAPATVPGFDGWALLDLRTGSVIRTGSLPESAWAFDDFSPDGVHVAAGFFGGRVWNVDTRTGRAVGATPTRRVSILWLGWSPDGSRILTADSAGTLGLWDASTATEQDTVTVPGDAVAAGQFRPGTTERDGPGRFRTRPHVGHPARARRRVRLPHRRPRPDLE